MVRIGAGSRGFEWIPSATSTQWTHSRLFRLPRALQTGNRESPGSDRPSPGDKAVSDRALHKQPERNPHGSNKRSSEGPTRLCPGEPGAEPSWKQPPELPAGVLSSQTRRSAGGFPPGRGSRNPDRPRVPIERSRHPNEGWQSNGREIAPPSLPRWSSCQRPIAQNTK